LKTKKHNIYYFIAGEASGDLHGAALIKHLKSFDDKALFYGVGGDQMVAQGLQSLLPMKQISVMGFVEVFKRLPFFLKLLNKVFFHIKHTKPTKVVLIDFPGFNLKLAKKIKQNSSINIIFYVSPQMWAWKENRLEYIKKYVDKLIVLFPFEKNWYENRGVDVKYFGHPLVETYQQKNDENPTLKYDINPNNYIVALFPGSRKQEIKRHLPIFKKTVALVQKKIQNIHFIIRASSNINIDIENDLGLFNKYTIEKNNSFRAFDSAHFAIVASGTATLECAITNTPFVVVYKTSYISWLITKIFIKVPFASIVNILNNKKIVEEFLQHNASSKKISSYVVEYINNNETVDFSHLVNSLSLKNTYQNTAAFIVDFNND